MRIVLACVFALLLWVGFALGVSTNVLSQDKEVSPGQSLRNPSDLVQFSREKFCFYATDGECNEKNCPRRLICSFDFEHFSDVDVTLPFCGSKGVVVEEHLHCPQDALPVDDEDNRRLSFSTVSFSAGDDSLSESLNNEQIFDFKFNNSDFEAVSARFEGNVFKNGRGTHFSVVTLVNEDGERQPSFFRSRNGFEWDFISKLPFTEGTEFHGVWLGGKRFGVTTLLSNGTTQSVTSVYSGKYWSSVKNLNTTAHPHSLSYGSGVRLEYATSNATSRSPTVFIEGQNNGTALDILPPHAAGGNVLFVSQNTTDGKKVIAIHESDADEKGRSLRFSSAIVDDREEEEKERLARIEKEVLERKKEADRLRAQLEQQERQKRERRARLKREEERKEKFHKADAANVERALEAAKETGEVIIIRRVAKENIDLERETFFDF